MMIHLLFFAEFLTDQLADWRNEPQIIVDSHGEFLEVHSQPLENHWLKKNLSKQLNKWLMHEKSWNPLNQWYLMCVSTT